MKRIKFFGLPGSGKTTVIETLKQDLGLKLRIINDNLTTEKMLRALWTNPAQNSVTFQHMLIEREKNQEIKLKKDLVLFPNFDYVIDHTPVEMIEFFNHAYLASTYLSEFSFEQLQIECNKVRTARQPDNGEKDIYVFLHTPIEQVMKNIEKRGRAGESFHENYVFTHIHYAIETFKNQNLSRKHITVPYEENIIDITGICGLLDIDRNTTTSYESLPVLKM